MPPRLGAAAVFHLAVGLPDGRLSRRRLALVVGGYVAVVGAGRPRRRRPGRAGRSRSSYERGVGRGRLAVVVRSCRRATARDRARLQWAGWAAS